MSDSTTESPLARELATFEAHRQRLVAQAEGRFVLIKEDQVVDTFADEMEAVRAGWEQFGNVPFLVMRVAEHDEPLYFPSPM